MFFPHDLFIGRSLSAYGEYSELEVKLLTKILHPGDVAIEAGAHIGALTVPMAKRVGPSGRIFAFEPQRAIFEMLCGNAALNGHLNVIPKMEALGADYESMRMPEIDYEKPFNFGDIRPINEAPKSAWWEDEVIISPIDHFGVALPHLRLIKIDVQGMEEQVLRGAEQTIAKHRPFIYVEEEAPSSVPAILRSFGYELYWHRPPLFNPENFDRRNEDIFENVASFNILAVPRDAYPSVRVELEKVE